MNKKQIASIIGIVVGVIIIIIGFSIQGTNVDSSPYLLSSSSTIGSSIKFGADFYTEIYAVTQDVGEAVNSAQRNIGGSVNNAQRNICQAIESICNAIGWLIVVLGMFNICYFVNKLFDAEDSYTSIYKASGSCPSSGSVSQSITKLEPIAPVKAASVEAETWSCGNCGAENSMNYGQCKKCGKFRG